MENKEKQDLLNAMNTIQQYCDSKEDCVGCMFYNPKSYPLMLHSDETFGCYIENRPYTWIIDQFKGE